MSKKVFVSHSVKDKEIADAFVDVILHGALSVPIDEIFCISTEGTKIKSGEDWRDNIKENLFSAEVIFFLISPNYKESEVCLNEMGAAWMMEAEVLPLIIEPITYKTVGVIQQPKQIEKLQDEESLDRIKDIIHERLKIENKLIKSDRWTVKKKEFLAKVTKHLEANPFEPAMDKDAFKRLIQERIDLGKTIDSLIQEKTEQAALIEALKKAKDKTAVAAIIKESNVTSKFEEFMDLCKEVKKLLSPNGAILNGIIFNTYSRKGLTISGDGYGYVLDEARAKDYVNEDLDADFDTTKKMKDIHSALNKVSSFMKFKTDPNFDDEYVEAFDAPFDINNMEFWEDVLEVDITIN